MSNDEYGLYAKDECENSSANASTAKYALALMVQKNILPPIGQTPKYSIHRHSPIGNGLFRLLRNIT